MKTHTHLIHRGDFIDALIGVLPQGMVNLGKKARGIVGQRRQRHRDLRRRLERHRRPRGGRRRHQVRHPRAAVQRPAARLRRRARLPRRDPRRRRPTAWPTTTTSACTSAAARRSTSCRCAIAATSRTTSPARRTTRTWAPQRAARSELLALVEGFDERIVKITQDLDMAKVNVRAVYDIDPVDTWHSGLRRPARRRRARHVPPPGPGRELRHPRRRRTRRRAGAGRLGPGGARPVPGHPQAHDRRAAAHLAPGLERGRGIDDVFPGQKTVGARSGRSDR